MVTKEFKRMKTGVNIDPHKYIIEDQTKDIA
jgi:hypothetical protein